MLTTTNSITFSYTCTFSATKFCCRLRAIQRAGLNMLSVWLLARLCCSRMTVCGTVCCIRTLCLQKISIPVIGQAVGSQLDLELLSSRPRQINIYFGRSYRRMCAGDVWWSLMWWDYRAWYDMTGINESHNCTQSFSPKVKILGKILNLEGNTKNRSWRSRMLGCWLGSFDSG